MTDKKKKRLRILAATAVTAPFVGYAAYKFGDGLIAKAIQRTNLLREGAGKEVFGKDMLESEQLLKKWELLKTSSLEKHKARNTVVGTTLLAGGIGAGLAITNNNSQTAEALDRARGIHPYTGQIPVNKQSATKILKNIGKKNPLAQIKDSDELGSYLRALPKRPMFGDDSELMLFGVKNKTPYVYNIGTTASGKSYIKGKNFGIVDDSTTGGIELNVSPGNSDQLHQNVREALTTGAEKVNVVGKKKFVLVNNTLAELTGYDHSKPLSDRHVAVGASSHIHFSAPANKLKATTHRVIGATAPLNYLIPTANERARGYVGHGTYSAGYEYGKTIPYAYVWENKHDKGLAAAHGYTMDPERSKHQPWYPKRGHLATEVRFNAPMHGDPLLSKKYHQLIELALSDTEHATKLETLGRNIEKWTVGNHSNLYKPAVRSKVLTEYKKILGTAFKGDTALQHIIGLVEKGKQLPIQNVITAWKNFK